MLNNPNVIQPVSWGHRNGYAIRFAPEDHPLRGQLLVGEDGADERGARPSNGAPEVLSVDQQNPDGKPVYHGWPELYGFLAASQAVFNPVGGASDDLCVFDASNPPSFCTSASLANILKFDVPVADVLAFPPAPIEAPLALEAADSSFTESISCRIRLLAARYSVVRRCTPWRAILAFRRQTLPLRHRKSVTK